MFKDIRIAIMDAWAGLFGTPKRQRGTNIGPDTIAQRRSTAHLPTSYRHGLRAARRAEALAESRAARKATI